jgi:alpha-L-fucosidase
MKTIIFTFIACFILSVSYGQGSKLAKPTPVQYSWQEQGRIMFITYGPATWQGREYDNHSTSLSRINPKALNTDQWCRVAKSWGAKEILFVAKHVGGFCWWPTKTTDYNISHTPYQGGKGDVLGQLSASCKKYGLNLGIYVYPGNDLGSAGKTKDPSQQAAYNKTYREQLKEVLTRYGDIKEIWFDGSCQINVKDILQKYAPNAVVFQGPEATIRWAGNEDGKLSYPAWNSLKRKDLETGVATEQQSDPNGDAWAPLEADVPLYDHYWFWSPVKEKKCLSLNQLMDVYYKSVGYGGVMLLNATPDTTGLIPANDVKLYAQLGKEINRRFGNPLARVEHIKGYLAEVSFQRPTVINHAIIMEDYRQGERIRSYIIEGFEHGLWKKLTEGISVGRKKIDYFNNVTVSRVRLRVLQAAATPLIRSFAVYHVTGFIPFTDDKQKDWKVCAEWNSNAFKDGHLSLKVNLTPFIPEAGQYEIKIIPSNRGKKSELHVDSVALYFQAERAQPEFLKKIDAFDYSVNQTQQVTKETSTELLVDFSVLTGKGNGGEILIKRQ